MSVINIVSMWWWHLKCLAKLAVTLLRMIALLQSMHFFDICTAEILLSQRSTANQMMGVTLKSFSDVTMLQHSQVATGHHKSSYFSQYELQRNEHVQSQNGHTPALLSFCSVLHTDVLVFGAVPECFIPELYWYTVPTQHCSGWLANHSINESYTSWSIMYDYHVDMSAYIFSLKPLFPTHSHEPFIVTLHHT